MAIRALVTGGSGFIGSHLVENLAARQWEVTCWCRPQSRTEMLEKLGANLVRGRLEDISLLEETVRGQDYVFHVAARIHSAPRDVYEQVNHVFTRNLVQACCAAQSPSKRLVYVSSIAAAGPSDPGQIKTEQDPCSPRTEYGRTKLRGEEAVQSERGRLPATIIRPPSVYGPRQRETELLMRLMHRRIVPVLKKRNPATSLIYVKDLVEGMVQAALSEKALHQIYYLTDGRDYSWRKIFFAARDALLPGSLYLPLPEPVILLAATLTDTLKRLRLLRSYFGRRAWHNMTRLPWLFSIKKARDELGFSPQYSLESGLKETTAEYVGGTR
jgi:dihydroflavonol-4-reductase